MQMAAHPAAVDAAEPTLRRLGLHVRRWRLSARRGLWGMLPQWRKVQHAAAVFPRCKQPLIQLHGFCSALWAWLAGSIGLSSGIAQALKTDEGFRGGRLGHRGGGRHVSRLLSRDGCAPALCTV